MEPLIFEDFDGPYTNRVSPDGVWRLAGPWTGTGGNWLDPNLAKVSGGQLSLTVAANELRGSEIQTLDGYSYGYYETSMKVAPTSGVVNSFFVIAEGYDPGTIEIDMEILTNESWINSPDSGRVHFVLHPSNEQRIVDLDFNPALGFHRYGFLWEPGKVSYTIDGEIVAVNNDPRSNIGTDTAYIMMNAWTGNPSWGGGPPKQNATSYYDFVKFYDGVTKVITTVRGTAGNDGLAGGTNTDVFEASTGNDVFRNFTAGVDYIDFSAFGSLSASDVSASLVGGNLRLSFNGNTITVEGVSRLAAGETSLGAAFVPGGTPDPDPEPTNTAPDARNDSGLSTAYQTPITIAAADLLANDVDADGDSLNLTGVSAASGGTVSLNNAGNVVFTPSANFSGAAGFTYSIADGNGGSDSARVSLTVGAAPTPDPEPPAEGNTSGLWDDDVAPVARTDSDRSAVELGMKFRVNTDGEIAAIQFYETAESNGSHPVSLWTAGGQLLATKDFSGGSGAGWREVAFDAPVKVQAGETYIASYHSPKGRYAVSEDFFWQSVDGGDLTALRQAGVYSYGPAGLFPDDTYRASNYWADVVFKASAAASASEAPASLTLTGTSSADSLAGGAGSDTIRGLKGNDRIQGNGGADDLRGGGGSDTFIYVRTGDSTPAASDTIRGFHRGVDKIDLTAIDAVAGGGNNAFTWIGNHAFSGVAGQLRTQSTESGLVLQGDVNGDGTADLSIKLDAHYHAISVSDVLL